MSKLLQLREYGTCTFWLESLKSKSTMNAYTIHLSLFCNFHNTNPNQLIQLNNSDATQNYDIKLHYTS